MTCNIELTQSLFSSYHLTESTVMHHHENRTTNRKGVIRLVVLSSLTFFSILVDAYLVFSNESRDASLALSKRSTREPDVNWIMNEALMTLVRGTNDPSNPFYGEDLLSDFYGHDGLSLQVKNINQYVKDNSKNL